MRRRARFKENFDASSWSLSDTQTSADGRWYCEYKSAGTADVRTSTGSSRTGKVHYQKPSYTSGQTKSVYVRNTVQYYDFECVFDMRTVTQNRTPTPNNWETAWVIFRFTDNWHHYYLLIQGDGGLELGRKDYATQIEQQQFLVTNANTAPPFVLGQWYNIRIRCYRYQIKVWIDGVLQCNITDDGTFGFDSNGGGIPPPPTTALLGGYFGFYNEDAEAEFDNFVIRAL
jgi:hypothetical protein